MATGRKPTIGEEQAALLQGAIQQFNHAPLDGARSLPELTGLHAPPKAIYTQPQDNVILRAISFLIASGNVFAYGSNIVYQTATIEGACQSLIYLRVGHDVEARANCRLANLFTCQAGPIMFPPPAWFVSVLFMSDLLNSRLPRILIYANRPVFDENYQLCSPGWHPESGVLVHGSDVEPVLPDAVDPEGPAIERLPPHVKNLLSGFCFRSDADVANAVAMLLTGLLANHFVTDPKGLFLVDGNQPGLGKSLLVECVGMVMDGVEPRFLAFLSDDTELEKKLCALLRGRWQSLVFIDNAKAVGAATISSQVIEANSVAPEVSLRILGKSEMYTRPNDLLWVLTMNDTRVSPDIVSRGVPIQLAYEGRPEDRTFNGPAPLDYAKNHRLEILGEIAGMVLKWNQTGRPTGDRSHRCAVWAEIVGGILNTVGLPEFLANAGDAAAAFNSQLDELAALAEAVVAHNGPFVEIPMSEEDEP